MLQRRGPRQPALRANPCAAIMVGPSRFHRQAQPFMVTDSLPSIALMETEESGWRYRPLQRMSSDFRRELAVWLQHFFAIICGRC